MSLRQKIGFAFCGFTLAISAALGTYYSLNKTIDAELEQAHETFVEIDRAALALEELTVTLNTILREPKPGQYEKLSRALERVTNHLDKSHVLSEDASSRESLSKLKALLQSEMNSSLEEFSHAPSDRPDQLKAIYSAKYLSAHDKATDAIDEIGARCVEFVKSLRHKKEQQSRLIVLIMSILLIVSLALALAFSHSLTKSLIKAIDTISANLTSCSEDIMSLSFDVNHSSQQLAAVSSELNSVAAHSSTSVESIHQLLNANSVTTKNSEDLAKACLTNAETGQQTVDAMISAVKNIDVANTSVTREINESFDQMSSILELIYTIVERTKVINDIVFQTKLLSFNASVEAARAGDYGKGFSVVAREVGNLALMSGKAAEEISALLRDKSTTIEASVKNAQERVSRHMAEVETRVKGGLSNAELCGNSLIHIVGGVDQVKKMIITIGGATSDLTSLMNQVVGQSREIASSTGNVKDNSDKAGLCAARLGQQSQNLGHMVKELVKLENALSGKRSA